MRSATPNQALQTPLPSTLLSPASISQFSLEPPHSLGVPLPHPLKRLFLLFLMFSTGCSGKIVFFAPFTATPPSPTLLKETFKALNAMRVNSHSHCKRPSKLSTQCECTCTVTPIGWYFFVQPIAAD